MGTTKDLWSSSRKSCSAFVLVSVIGILSAPPAHAFKPKTHIWIGQQVLNDVLPDGAVTVDGREYPVAPEIVEALRQNQNEYRMGHVGPDAYPDVVVGQMVIHPGVPRGFQTDDWLRYLAVMANGNPRNRALTLGMIGHAAGDIFAHSYVNSYSGDIFSLTDGEQTVEARHIALEAFIEQHTPDLVNENGQPVAAYSDAISSTPEFIRDSLIVSQSAAQSYLMVPAAAPHLVAMRGAIVALNNFQEELNRFGIEIRQAIDLKTALKLRLLQESEGLRRAFDPIRIQFEAAQAATEVTSVEINAQIRAIDEATRGLDEVNRNIARIEAELQEAARTIPGLASGLADVQTQIERVPQFVLQQTCRVVQQQACHHLSGWRCAIYPPACLICRTVDQTVCSQSSILNQAWQALASSRSELSRRQGELVARAASLNIELVSYTSRRGPYQATIAAAETQKRLLEVRRDGQVRTVNSLSDAYSAARDRLERALQEVVRVEADLERMSFVATARVNPAQIVIDAWRNDMLRAATEYANTSFRVTQELLRPGGRPLDAIREWKECWMPVFQGVPSPVSRTGCYARRIADDLVGKIDELHNSLVNELGIFGWVVSPSTMLRNEALRRFRETQEAAFRVISTSVLGPEMNTMIDLLSQGADDARLNELFRQDLSRKSLLVIPDIARRVRIDMGAQNAASFDPERFNAVRNAITLSKLTLLSAATLNRLVEGYSGQYNTRYGRQLFVGNGTDFNILYGTVRSIDGNHQWMRQAPPYLRRGLASYNRAPTPEYGRGFPDGFRLWQDPTARRQVFTRIFHGPLNPGLTDLVPAGYPYVCTPQDPFALSSSLSR